MCMQTKTFWQNLYPYVHSIFWLFSGRGLSSFNIINVEHQVTSSINVVIRVASTKNSCVLWYTQQKVNYLRSFSLQPTQAKDIFTCIQNNVHNKNVLSNTLSVTLNGYTIAFSPR